MNKKFWKCSDDVCKLVGTRIYAMKNPFGAWQVMSNDKIVADNLSLKEAKKQMIQIKNESIVSKVGE